MPYPFDSNPFERYFITLRRAILDEKVAWLELREGEKANEQLLENKIAHSNAEETLKKVRNRDLLPAREYDIYLGELEFALYKFEKEFPKPPKPEPCPHLKTQICVVTYRDESQHVITQCLDCGSK